MKVYVETYGCTANRSDESLLRGLLQQDHHDIVESIHAADILILLTCTVIGTTEQRMLSRLKVFQKENKRVIVAGCMPSVQPDLIKSVVPNAYLLPSQYTQYINDIINGKKPEFTETNKTLLPKSYTGVIAPISIAEGCMLSCSYCITHLAKGRLRSFPIEDIVADVRSALMQGCKEIQLTAQDTASYGLDTGENLGDLLTRVCAVNEEFRVRIGMMNPLTLKKHIDQILAAYAQPKIYTFLHLPIQSGDNDILTKMKRDYTVKDFIALVNRFRTLYPAGTLSTDIIIGFPTETEEQFHKTIDVLQKIQPDITNITRYSARPHTPAKTMNGRIPTHVVKKRSIVLSEICSNISKEKNQDLIGETYHVLVTEHGKKNTVTGRAENYKQVVVKESIPIGDVVHVEIIEAAPTHLVGKLI